MNGVLGHLCTYRPNWARRSLSMFSWMRWYCSPGTGFEIWPWAVWGQAHYLFGSPQYWIFKYCESEKETFCFFETWRSERGSNPRSTTFQAGSFNHCTRAPIHLLLEGMPTLVYASVNKSQEGRSTISVTLCNCRCLLYIFKAHLGRFSDKSIMFLPSQRWDIVSMYVTLGKVLYNDMFYSTHV